MMRWIEREDRQDDCAGNDDNKEEIRCVSARTMMMTRMKEKRKMMYSDSLLSSRIYFIIALVALQVMMMGNIRSLIVTAHWKELAY